MTRNGKIARLPKNVRDQLNVRIDDNESGKSLVEWLNSLPEAQALTSKEFDGKPIREQNLSEWKKGGYRDWQTRQQRQELLQELEESAKDSGSINHDVINRHLSVVLTAELAQAMRDVVEQTEDPRERAQTLAQIIGRFAQLRREESNASRVEVVREQWNKELEKREANKRACGALMPLQALAMQQIYIDMFSRCDARSLAAASELAANLGPETIPFPAVVTKRQSD